MIGGDEKWEAEAENGRRRQKMGDGGRKWAMRQKMGGGDRKRPVDADEG